MNALIRKVLGATLPAHDSGAIVFDEPLGADPAVMLAEARQRLRDAQGALLPAQGSLREASARLDRVRRVINDAGAAERALEEAETACEEATRAWAARGADPSEPRIPQAIIAARDAAHNAAIDARPAAAGAAQALPGLEESEREARLAVEQANAAIGTAARGVLSAMIEPHLQAIERASRELESAYANVRGLEVLFMGFGTGHPLHGFGDHTRRESIEQRLKACEPPAPFDDPKAANKQLWTDPVLRGSTEEWRDLGRRLLTDADAELL